MNMKQKANDVISGGSHIVLATDVKFAYNRGNGSHKEKLLVMWERLGVDFCPYQTLLRILSTMLENITVDNKIKR